MVDTSHPAIETNRVECKDSASADHDKKQKDRNRKKKREALKPSTAVDPATKINPLPVAPIIFKRSGEECKLSTTTTPKERNGLIIDHIIQGHLPTLGGPSIATFALRPGLRLIPCLCMSVCAG